MPISDIAANFTIFLAGIIFTLLAEHIVPFEYKKWREDKIEEKKEQKEWQENLRSLSENVITIRDNEIEGAEERNGTIDRKRVQRKMVSIADKLQALKSSNSDIENEVGTQIDQLINSCRSVDDFILAIGPSNYQEFKDEVRATANEAENLKELL